MKGDMPAEDAEEKKENSKKNKKCIKSNEINSASDDFSEVFIVFPF